MALKTLNKEAYIACARQMVAEGCVLLKNDNQALPIKKSEVFSFGEGKGTRTLTPQGIGT